MSGEAEWYVQKGARVLGPFSPDEVGRFLLLGRVRNTDRVSRDGELWEPVTQVPELVPEELLDLDASGGMERFLEARAHREERLVSVPVEEERRSGEDIAARLAEEWRRRTPPAAPAASAAALVAVRHHARRPRRRAVVERGRGRLKARPRRSRRRAAFWSVACNARRETPPHRAHVMAVTTLEHTVVTSLSEVRQQRLDVQLRQLEFHALLHRKLDLDLLFECLLAEGQSFVAFDGVRFRAGDRGADVHLGVTRPHTPSTSSSSSASAASAR